MHIIDTHTHLDMIGSDEDLRGVLHRAGAAGVERMVCVGTTLDASERCVELARRHSGQVVAAVGIHPNHCAQAAQEQFYRIAELTRLPEVVAVGETGLDYHHHYAPPEVQADWLRRHVQLARLADKPLIIHSRKADDDTLAILAGGGGVRGVRHCFDASAQTAEEYVKLGMHVAFGGALTQPGHKKLKAAAASVPADRLLVETDCPFMTPAGVPKGPNEPAYIAHVVRALAELRGVSAEDVAELTTRNAARLLLGEM